MPDFAAVASTIRTRFADQFGALRPTVPILYDNTSDQPPDTEPWVLLSVAYGEGAQAAMGSTRRWRSPGEAVVEVNVPTGEGDGEALAIADDAASVFRGASEAGVVFGAPSLERIGAAGTWYQVRVAVPWRADLDA